CRCRPQRSRLSSRRPRCARRTSVDRSRTNICSPTRSIRRLPPFRACARRCASLPPTSRMRCTDAFARRARGPRVRAGSIAAAAPVIAHGAYAQEASEWLTQAAQAARALNYVGTLVYQHGGRIETSRVLHLSDATGEHEKLVNLDGPPREVVRNNEQI